jgi:hypothetical protein
MCAQFTTIGEVLGSRNFTIPTLKCLEPDAAFYETLAIQPHGSITAAPGVLRHTDQPTAVAKFTRFVDLAVEQVSDIAVCPEYSMPWSVLSQAINATTFPQVGKLWIFGCEAISPVELTAFIAQHDSVEWIHESIPNTTGAFLGVLAYVTKVTTTAGVEKTVFVLQFKTQPMGGDAFERDNLICGTQIYIWHNPTDGIRLFSLICSDALNWQPDTAPALNYGFHPYLIFHLQLNSSPRHPGFSYRSTLFGISQEISQSFEVISLNWARGFEIPPWAPSDSGGSTIYTKAPQFDFTDARIDSNHRLGLYFANWQAQRVHLGIFNYDEHIFRYRNLKVRQIVGATQARRTGAEMLNLYRWDIQAADWQNTDTADDGFDTFCQPHGAANYYTHVPHTPLARERLLLFSSGKLSKIDHKSGWHHVPHLDSTETEADERSKRLTFTHEKSALSHAYRNEILGRFLRLQLNILTDPGHFPKVIEDLRGDVQLEPPSSANKFRRNLVSQSGSKATAIGIFLGPVSPAEALTLRDEIVTAWSTPKLPIYRIVVWYERLGAIVRTPDLPPPKYDEASQDPTSFTRESLA